MAGVRPFAFWLTNFIWDYLLYVLSAIVFLIVLVAADRRHIFSENTGGTTLLVLFMFFGEPLKFSFEASSYLFVYNFTAKHKFIT